MWRAILWSGRTPGVPVCPDRDEYRDELQRHGIGRWEQLQLPGPGNECREEPERISDAASAATGSLRSVLPDRAKRTWVVAEEPRMADTGLTATKK